MRHLERPVSKASVVAMIRTLHCSKRCECRREDAGVRHTDLQAAALTAASPMIAAEWLFDRYKVAVDMVSLANEHDNERLFC